MSTSPLPCPSESATERLQLAAITADGGPGLGASLVERSVSDLLRVVRDVLDLEVIFIGAIVEEERRFHRLPASAHRSLSEVSNAGGLGLDLERVPVGGPILVPVQFEDGSLYGMLCGFGPDPRQTRDTQRLKRLEIAAQSTARLLAQADGHDIAVSAAMHLRSRLVNHM